MSRADWAACVALFLLIPHAASAWQVEEHRALGDSALAEVLAECGADAAGTPALAGLRGPLLDGRGFGALCARGAALDLAAARCQLRERTVLEQIATLTPSLLEAAVAGAARAVPFECTSTARVREEPNAVANFLVQHLAAIRLASVDHDEAGLRRALAREAVAQGYLADAFSSAHLLLQLDDPFARLHGVNNRRAHDYYRAEGIYVLNGRGQVWQAFGDGLLEWFEPTFRHALEGSKCALREVLLAWFAGRDPAGMPEGLRRWADGARGDVPLAEWVSGWNQARGAAPLYAGARLPSLLELPTPIAASWSVRTPDRDTHGISLRRNYPQLRDQGLHDPGLGRHDIHLLPYSRAVPKWQQFPALPRTDPRDLVREDPDVASVIYRQERHHPPSYEGLVLRAGAGLTRFTQAPSTVFGAGWGLISSTIFLRKVSIDLLASTSAPRHGFTMGPSAGVGFDASGLPLAYVKVPGFVESVRIEVGQLWGIGRFKGQGRRLALGLESPTIPFGFTYAGMSVRLLNEWAYFDRTRKTVTLEAVLH